MARLPFLVAAGTLLAASTLPLPEVRAQAGGSPLPGLLAAEPPPEGSAVGMTIRLSSFTTEYELDKRVESLENPEVTALAGVLEGRRVYAAGFALDASLMTGHVVLDPETEDVGTTRASGFGDLEVGSSYDVMRLFSDREGDLRLRARFGLAFPTGDPGTLSILDAGLAPETTALGYGTFSGGLSLEVLWRVHPLVELRLPVTARRPLHRSKDGIYYGQQTAAALGVASAPLPWLDVAARIGWRRTGRSHQSSTGLLEDSGGSILEAEGGAGVVLGGRVRAGVFGRVPIFVVVNGRQIAETFTTGVTVSLTSD